MIRRVAELTSSVGTGRMKMTGHLLSEPLVDKVGSVA